MSDVGGRESWILRACLHLFMRISPCLRVLRCVYTCIYAYLRIFHTHCVAASLKPLRRFSRCRCVSLTAASLHRFIRCVAVSLCRFSCCDFESRSLQWLLCRCDFETNGGFSPHWSSNLYIYIYICIGTCVYIYIYVYTDAFFTNLCELIPI